MKQYIFSICIILSSIAHTEHTLVVTSSSYTDNHPEYLALYQYKNIIDISDTSYFSFDTEFLADNNSTTYINLKELKYQLESNEYEVSLGYDTIFWGVSETYNPVDVLNRKNNLTTYEHKDKLGEFMFSAQYFFEESTLSGYVLPRFESQEFLTNNSPRGISITSEHREKNTPAVALRYSHIIDEFDIGLSYFNGTSREPWLTPTRSRKFNAYYPHLTQMGIDIQYTGETTLYKLEYAKKQYTSSDNYALNMGLEYLFVSDIEISALLEILKSNNALNIYQNDIMIGMRFDFANESNTQGILSLIYDLEYYSTISNITISNRVSDTLKLEANINIVDAKNNDIMLQNVIDNLNITLSYFF